MQLDPHKAVDAFQLEGLGHECTYARCDEHCAGTQGSALGGGDVKAPGICLRLQGSYLRVQVPLGLEGGDLLLQQGCQFAPGAHGHARNVVDGLAAIQLHALAARVGQRVNDVG